MLQETQHWFMSDEGETLPPGVVDDGSMDPGGFFTDDMLEVFPALHAEVADGFLPGKLDDVQEGGPHKEAAEDDDGGFQCTLDELLGFCDNTAVACPTPAPTIVSSESGSFHHVRAECALEDCELFSQ
jgi:hypothetical protein